MSVFTAVRRTLSRLDIKISSNLRSIYRAQSTQQNQEEKVHSEETYEEDVKSKILAASLPFVNELGWTKEAIGAGAQNIGYPGIIHGMFPRGGADLIQHFQTQCNKKLLKDYLHKIDEKSPNFDPLLVIEDSIVYRLKMILPYLTKWPQAMAIMSLPSNVPTTLATLLTMVDDICYYAGDRSVDSNWYIRRVTVAGVYQTSEFYLVQDKSVDNKEAWKFVNRRMKDVRVLHDIVKDSEMFAMPSKENITSAFITARNILGINFTR